MRFDYSKMVQGCIPVTEEQGRHSEAVDFLIRRAAACLSYASDILSIFESDRNLWTWGGWLLFAFHDCGCESEPTLLAELGFYDADDMTVGNRYEAVYLLHVDNAPPEYKSTVRLYDISEVRPVIYDPMERV